MLANLPPDYYRKEQCERSLKEFLVEFWPKIDPAPFIDGWHIDALCLHLEAVTRGDIRNLLITIPPRHMKSISVSVAWPAWSWIEDAGMQFLFSSYAQNLSTRDAVKSRRVIQSPQYDNWWGEKFQMTGDQNAKQRYENDQGGYRLATSVGGALTGDGGDVIVCDDPHNVAEGESDPVRMGTLEWWKESMSTRENNPKTSRRVVIQQRVHENDLAGHIIEEEGLIQDGGIWVHLNLPAEFEEDNRCITYIRNADGDIEEFWRDPRTKEGQLLCPERFGEEELQTLKTRLGEYGTAGQLQQRPSPRQGGMFEVDQIVKLNHIPAQIIESVRYWDKAGSIVTKKNKEPAYTAGCKMIKVQKGLGYPEYIITDMVRGRWKSNQREEIIKNKTEQDGIDCEVYVEQEPGSGGKESAESTISNLAGYIIRADRPSGDKTLRADPLSVQVNAGNVGMLGGDWNTELIDELRLFPRSRFKDQTDAAAAAFSKLTTGKSAGTW
jgi:predicted phage terminase large subunit-like protein